MEHEVIMDRHELLLMLQKAFEEGADYYYDDPLRDGWIVANEMVDEWERRRLIRKNLSPAQKMIDIYDLKG